MLVAIRIALVFALLSLFSTNLYATDTSIAGQAKLMWEAFTCATYAEVVEDGDEQKRLFVIGLDVGREFVDKVKSGGFEENAADKTPVAVLLRLGGPTTDFVVGRIYEGAAEYAHDKVTKGDNAAVFDPTLQTEEGKKIWANTLFSRSNCSLLK